MSAKTAPPGLRTLPFVTAPQPGETLSSWLSATATRHGVDIGSLYTQIGLTPARDLHRRLDEGQVGDDVIAAISAATGRPTADIAAMTLQPYAMMTAETFGPAHRLTTLSPRHRVAGSQFCPHCLAASGGVWKTHWLLTWSFACIEHRCLLADHCPRCGRRHGTHGLLGAVHPGQCPHPAPARGESRARVRCDADLGETPAFTLPADHPALTTQHAVNELFARSIAAFGVYRRYPRPTSDALTDLRLLGRNILASAADHHLEYFVPPDLACAYSEATTPRHTTAATPSRNPSWSSGPAVIRAVALTAAVSILSEPDVYTAAARLAKLPDDLPRYSLNRPVLSDDPAAPAASPILRSIQLICAEKHLGPVQQLHYQLGTPLPLRPDRDSERPRQLQSRIPTRLWPAWTSRLCPPATYQPSMACALSAALLMVATTLEPAQAAAILGGAITADNIEFLLWRLKTDPGWPDIRAALIELSEHLWRDGTPIDYQRRRQLSYTALLPASDFSALCRRIGKQPQGRGAARNWLIELIGAAPASTLGRRLTTRESQAVNDFARRLTPELSTELHDYAQRFLSAQGADDEPVTWAPNLGVLGPRRLPGVDLEEFDATELHRLLRDDQRSMVDAATALGVSTSFIRSVLQRHPVPRRIRQPRHDKAGPRRPRPAYQRAVEVLPAEHLRTLYCVQRESLQTIADCVGVSSGLIARLARDYGIPLRTPGRTNRPTIDPDWLYQQHVVHQRSMRDLSRETHINPETLAAAARKHAVPVRSVSRVSHDQLAGNPRVPALLVPALVGHGGWERLQRFLVIEQHTSFTAASKTLEIGLASVGDTVHRLERDFERNLVVRSARHRLLQPVRTTPFGRRVVAATTELIQYGGP